MNAPKKNEVAEHDAFICMSSNLYHLKMLPVLGMESL